jgi:hypothetical protein
VNKKKQKNFDFLRALETLLVRPASIYPPRLTISRVARTAVNSDPEMSDIDVSKGAEFAHFPNRSASRMTPAPAILRRMRSCSTTSTGTWTAICIATMQNSQAKNAVLIRVPH